MPPPPSPSPSPPSRSGSNSAPIISTPVKNEECVRVVVRCRPLSEKEVMEGNTNVAEFDTRAGRVILQNPRGDPKLFTFDAVYGGTSTQANLFNETALPIVESVLDGYNGTIFAYGQTGSGKTFTMEGKEEPKEMRGIVSSAAQYIFDFIDNTKDKRFLVRASFMEIYKEEIFDLLAKRAKLQLKDKPDTGVFVNNLTHVGINSLHDMEQILKIGRKNRRTGATAMNPSSSRSHSVFTITVETAETRDGQEHIWVGKLNLVDLAGSERQSKTHAEGERFDESVKINLSLLALGNVIKALVDKNSSHIPYRDSKLTRILQDSLGGNTRTVMIANIGPADYNYDETISTLRYADRAKQIKNKPHINEDPKDALLRQYQDEISRLRSMLSGQTESASTGQVPLNLPRGMSKEEFITFQSKAQAEQDQIMKERGLLQEEVQIATKDLQKHQEILHKEREEREAMSQRLMALEHQVVQGGQHISNQKKELLQARKQYEQSRAERETLQRALQQQEEALEETRTQFSSMQEELQYKTQRLKKLFARHQAQGIEMQDKEEEHSREREYLLDTVRQLSHELQLSQMVIDHFVTETDMEEIRKRAHWDEEREVWTLLRPYMTEQERHISLMRVIIDHFIPEEEREKIERRSRWDEARNGWIMTNLAATGNRIRPERPPSCAMFRRRGQGSRDGLLDLTLDLPERRTSDYERRGFGVQEDTNISPRNANTAYYSYADVDGLDEDPPRSRPSTAARKTGRSRTGL